MEPYVPAGNALTHNDICTLFRTSEGLSYHRCYRDTLIIENEQYLCRSNVYRSASDKKKVTNDLIGNLPIQDLATSINNGWYYEMFEPYMLLDLIDERLSNSECSDQDRKVLEDIKNSIDEDGNNIMFMGKLKDHVNINQ